MQIAGKARKLMHRLGRWASLYECAIVLIGHMNKRESGKGLYRSLGSIDVVAAARSVLQVERDTTDSDLRIVKQIKNNLAPTKGDIQFRIDPDNGFQWVRVEAVSQNTCGEDIQRPVEASENKTDRAFRIIKEMMCGGELKACEIFSRLATEHISRRTGEIVKKELGIQSLRRDGQWYWVLPNTKATSSVADTRGENKL